MQSKIPPSLKIAGLLLGGLVVCIAVFVAVYRAKYPTYTYRYRMTVTVEVDGEPRSGSSVIEVNVRKNSSPMFEKRVLLESVQGEAAFVPVRGGLDLVALLASGSYGEDVDYPTRVVPGVFELDTFDERVRDRLPGLRGRRELSGKWLPTLVQVSDPNDSATLRVIRPDEFDQVFGPGVRWRGVTIDMTTDAVTHGIEERLPFLIKERENRYLVYTRPNMFTPNYSYFVRSW
jgi:hypothetical protein